MQQLFPSQVTIAPATELWKEMTKLLNGWLEWCKL
jgi:hypothetical protein